MHALYPEMLRNQIKLQLNMNKCQPSKDGALAGLHDFKSGQHTFMGALTLDQPATESKHIEPPGAMFSKGAARSRNTVVYADGHHFTAYQKVRRTDIGLNWPTAQGAST